MRPPLVGREGVAAPLQLRSAGPARRVIQGCQLRSEFVCCVSSSSGRDCSFGCQPLFQASLELDWHSDALRLSDEPRQPRAHQQVPRPIRRRHVPHLQTHSLAPCHERRGARSHPCSLGRSRARVQPGRRSQCHGQVGGRLVALALPASLGRKRLVETRLRLRCLRRRPRIPACSCACARRVARLLRSRPPPAPAGGPLVDLARHTRGVPPRPPPSRAAACRAISSLLRRRRRAAAAARGCRRSPH
mmetsp:Transcript_36496/g.117186  ORF Transcript_36496/g.117186 Transcript_36496/m.117186 type:complete len:246 (-) Transcript_36496:548-1285(-)